MESDAGCVKERGSSNWCVESDAGCVKERGRNWCVESDAGCVCKSYNGRVTHSTTSVTLIQMCEV